MPLYTYHCKNKHTFDLRAGWEDATMKCKVCGKPAKRQACYREQGVIFKGTGFTTSVIPPAPPKPTTKAGEPISDWEEKTHEYASKHHKDDVTYRDDRKEMMQGMMKEVEDGKGFKRV